MIRYQHGDFNSPWFDSDPISVMCLLGQAYLIDHKADDPPVVLVSHDKRLMQFKLSGLSDYMSVILATNSHPRRMKPIHLDMLKQEYPEFMQFIHP